MSANKKVVVADDETHILHIVTMKLNNAGYQVLTAVDGEEALEVCLAEKPDLLITDFQMPLLTGLEVCRRLRENEATAKVPVIMLTARGFDISAHEMASAGIVELLSKPFSPREVLEKVQRIIGPAAPPAAAHRGGDPLPGQAIKESV